MPLPTLITLKTINFLTTSIPFMCKLSVKRERNMFGMPCFLGNSTLLLKMEGSKKEQKNMAEEVGFEPTKV